MDIHIRLHKDKVELVGEGNQVLATKEKSLSEVVDSGFLSIEVRYHNPLNQIMVIERPPALNSIAGQVRGAKNKLYDIPVPWQIYVIDYTTGSVRVFFRKEQLKSLDDEVFLSYLDHVKPDGQSCTDGQHGRNVNDLLEIANEDPVKGCIDLINDSIWGGYIRGLSYYKWYADIPEAIKKEDKINNHVSKTLDEKFDVARVMNEVELLSYGGEFTKGHAYWSKWFKEPLTVKGAVKLTLGDRQGSAKKYFERHV